MNHCYSLLLLFLPLLCGADDEPKEPKLRDLVKFGENTALFDALSAAVGNDLKNQKISNDFVEPNDPSIKRTFMMSRLNANYSDILFEHDIRPDREILEEMIGEISSFRRSKRQAFRKKSYPREIWKDGVPVAYHHSMTQLKRATVIAAMKYFTRHTCIRFRQRTKEDVYLYFVGHDAGCWSSVGRDPAQKQQWISIGDGCEPFGISSHEVAHALGLFHEQSRYDRDKHIQVLPGRIPSGLYYNFGKVGPTSLKTYGLPYEIGSVMHYGPTEFSKQPNVPSVVSKDPNFQYTMGSLSGPTFVDLQLLNAHYNCQSRCTLKAKCYNGGYNDPNRCGWCKCPEGVSGRQCLQREPPTVAGCGGLVRVTKNTRKIRVHIKKNPKARSLRNCIYHLAAPKGNRVEVRLKKLTGSLCETGCWRQAIELKPAADKRITGYRFCCSGYASRRLVSADHYMPVFLFTHTGEIEAELTFNIYQPNQQRGLNETIEEGSGVEDHIDNQDLSDYLVNENTAIDRIGHDALIQELPEYIKETSFVPESKKEGSSFTIEISTGTETDNLVKTEEPEPETLTAYPENALNPLSFIHPADLPTKDELKISHDSEIPIDFDAFERGQNPAQNRIPFSEAGKELKVSK